MSPAQARKTAKRRPGPRKMTAAHKAALAKGREMSAVVDRYLHAVNVPKKRGRKVSQAALRKRLATAQQTAHTATGVAKVLAAQEIRDLRARLADVDTSPTDTKALEASFVKIARKFSDSRGITYAAWRDAGVPPRCCSARASRGRVPDRSERAAARRSVLSRGAPPPTRHTASARSFRRRGAQ